MTLLRKPVSIVLISTYYIVSPFINLLQILWLTRLPLSGPVNLWTILNPSDWAILVAFPVVGVGMFTVRKWGWIAFELFSVFLIGYNTYSYLVNHTYSVAVLILYNVTLALVTLIFFRRHLRAPYFNPRLRWWNADPRYQTNLRANFITGESHCEAEVLDVSKTGIFLSVCADVEVGQVHHVEIHAFDRHIRCRGKVMRKVGADSAVPGFGIMFEGMDPQEKREINLLLARLVADGARERGWPSDAPLKKDPVHRHLVWYARRLCRELLGA